MRAFPALALAACVALAVCAAAAALSGARAWALPKPRESSFSHAALDTVLRGCLRDGRVDYRGLAAAPGPLRRYLAAVAEANPEGWPEAEQVAFWVNAYNALVLEGVIRRPGLKSVLDVGKTIGIPTLGFFRERHRVARELRSLDDIEHRILRERFHEPRVHFVLNCASTSCPVLPERALSGGLLESELERATVRFLTDRTRNHISPPAQLELSSIFKWYREDFERSAGSLAGFVGYHWPKRVTFQRDARVRFLPYDWSLNGSW